MSHTRTIEHAIARRYARAAFALAQTPAAQEQLCAELRTLADAASQSEPLADALRNPLLGRAAKAALLAALGEKAGPLTRRTLQVLAKGGRADLIAPLAEALEALLSEARGELVAQITSARPLSGKALDQIKESLARATGRTLQLRPQIDPALIGGVVVQVGSLRLDASLAGALGAMRQHLLSAGA